MFNWLDNLLNRITMYRLVVYFLLILVGIAMVLGGFQLIPYSPWAILASTLFITAVCWVANTIFAWAYDVPANNESYLITALILALLIAPIKSAGDITYLSLAFWASTWAMGSKYILAINRKHIFNPAAIGVAITALTLGQSAIWWVGVPALLPVVIIGGLLIGRKVIRFDLIWTFVAAAIISIIASHISDPSSWYQAIKQMVVYSPMLFFAFIMLTEPLTAPTTKTYRLIFAVIVGALFNPHIHIGSVYSTPELALLVGNIFAYIVTPKFKQILRLTRIEKIAPDIYDLVFPNPGHIHFQPGQYLEWTLGHSHQDDRGNRRYFTIASSPTESELRIGVKSYAPASSFKKALLAMRKGFPILAGQLAGDFTLPGSSNRPIIFIAGGIGITPFRSMTKYLIDKKQSRPVTLFYSNKRPEDIVYKDIFETAAHKIKMKTIYTITEKGEVSGWSGEKGYVDSVMIKKHAPNYRESIYYISGPHGMVTQFERTLANLGIPKHQIKTDFFPGFV